MAAEPVPIVPQQRKRQKTARQKDDELWRAHRAAEVDDANDGTLLQKCRANYQIDTHIIIAYIYKIIMTYINNNIHINHNIQILR